MPVTISVVLHTLRHLLPDTGALELHGANLAIRSYLKAFLADERVGALEVFLEPIDYVDQGRLAEAAKAALPSWRRGQGVLRFYPSHHLPDVWADGTERIMWCIDPAYMARERSVRDRFASGPTPLVVDTHGLGHHSLWRELAPLSQEPPVPYDSLVCLSSALKSGFEAAFDGMLGGVRPCRLDVVPRPVDTGKFKPATSEAKADARSMLGIPASVRNVVLFLGRLTPNHKADLLPLLQAFARVAFSDDFLLVVGPENAPGYRDVLAKEAGELGLHGRVMLRGEIDPDFRPLAYAAADVFVFPGDTVQEALGNTVCEAMASGLPVVCSDWDGFKDLVVDGETGFLVPTYWVPGTGRSEAVSPLTELPTHYLMLAQSVLVDSDVLADRLGRLLRDAGLRQTMGAAGRARAESQLAPRVLADRLVTLFEELLDYARGEDGAARQTRRERAQHLGLMCPRSVFASYATGDLGTTASTVDLTDAGREVVAGRRGVGLYDEVLAVTHAALYEAVLHDLSHKGVQDTHTFVDSLSQKFSVDPSDIWFHVGVLAKRGHLSLKVAKPV